METNNKECIDDNFKEIEVNLNNQMLCTLHSHMEKVCDLFRVQFVEKRGGSESFDQSAVFALFGDDSRDSLALSQELKKYLENVSSAEAEDSSYDSECDNDEKQISPANLIHEKVSRTASDTLGQEFAEYVNNDEQQYTPLTQGSPGYNARVEFALKLGYTERLVQTALTRLGPDPAQNELLAELIKLGAQQSPKGEYTPDADSAAGSRSASTFVQNVDTSNSLSTQICGPDESASNFLRPIVIDGSNVAMSHGNKEVFSCLGIKICVDWFKNRGHKDITVFVPKWRKENARLDNPIKDQDILNELERERMLVFTPSRLVGGKRMVCYDDRYILKLAADNDGIVVSNDNYRDLIQESSEFKKVVEERVLMYSFVNDRFMPPDDPLGRSGPTLDNFLRMQPKKSDPPPPCPYGKKCTYGNKCKFNHPERGLGPHKTVTERLSEHAARHLSARNLSTDSPRLLVQGKSQSVPLGSTCVDYTEFATQKQLCRTRSGASDNISSSKLSPASSAPWEAKATEISEKHCKNFSKSHSTENISPEKFSNLLNVSQSNHMNMWPTNTLSANPCLQQRKKQQTITQKNTQAVPQEHDESTNLHRKLKRQLTLNPSGCDPRIFRATHGVSTNNSNNGIALKVPNGHQTVSQHRMLGPSLSGPTSHHFTQWDLHQCVTRIASAPDSSRSWHVGPPTASSSEPHINLWPNQQRLPVLAAQDQRRRLHYHLSSIFPEDEVHTVMQLYPDETDPQRICAAILHMFPKM